MDHCAVTDHGVMYGVVDFYSRLPRTRGIHPVIGCEVLCLPRYGRYAAAMARDYNHLILLCENETGYKNLTHLVSDALDARVLLPAPHRSPAARRAHGGADLPVRVPAGRGAAGAFERSGRQPRIARWRKDIVRLFGRDNFFIEIAGSRHRRGTDGAAAAGAAGARDGRAHSSRRTTCHYLPPGGRRGAGSAHVHPDRQNARRREPHAHADARALPQNAAGNGARCFPSGPRRSSARSKSPSGATSSSISKPATCPPTRCRRTSPTPRAICAANASAASPSATPTTTARAQKRLDYELSTIESMGFVDYFLIVWDFINYAQDTRHHAWAPDAAAARARSSPIALGITAIDPHAVQPALRALPQPRARLHARSRYRLLLRAPAGQVIDYVAPPLRRRITWRRSSPSAPWRPRAVVRDVGRVLGMSLQPRWTRIAKTDARLRWI